MDLEQVSEKLTWINPLGGLGDSLMVSGVLKQVVELDPASKFNLVVRTKYPPILKGHPAIARIGHPPPGSNIMGTDYWSMEGFGRPDQRAYQVLAGMFGLKTPVEERLYVPWELEDDPILQEFIPWQKTNIMICPSSNSPRKQMAEERWEYLVTRLRGDGANVVQVGERSDRYIRGAYSLLGLTTPRQVVSLLRRFDAVLTSDNFLMHAAHLCGTRALVLWGPTDHRVYGYPHHVHMQSTPYERCADRCIGPGRGSVYTTECLEDSAHCMNQLDMGAVYRAACNVIDH